MDLKDFDWGLAVNGASKHLNTDEDFNENNHGLGITAEKEYDNIVKILTAGKYRNSYNDPSYYAGGGLARRFNKGDYYMDAGGIVGGVTGYDKTISPLAALMISLGKKDRQKLNLLLMPKTEKNPATLMMNLGIPFNID